MDVYKRCSIWRDVAWFVTCIQITRDLSTFHTMMATNIQTSENNYYVAYCILARFFLENNYHVAYYILARFFLKNNYYVYVAINSCSICAFRCLYIAHRLICPMRSKVLKANVHVSVEFLFKILWLSSRLIRRLNDWLLSTK